MTGAEFSGVDIDLLADYVGGALDGTPDEAVVAALIADDPSWRDAHDLLCGGVAAVTTQLQSLGSVPEAMPADISARLDAALAEASTESASPLAAGPRLAESTPPDQGEEPVVHNAPGGATVIAIGGARASGRGTAAPDQHPVAVPSDARRRRMRRLRGAAPVGIAAGVLAFVGFGVQQFGGSADSQTDSSAGTAAEQSAPQAATGQDLALPGVPAQISESGLDYRQATLGQVGARAMAAPDVPEDKIAGAPSGKSTLGAKSETGDALSRLRVQQALLACIDAIADKSGLAPITAQSIDFARFDGAPAVVVQFTARGGSWVWAVGPRCGTPGVGADKLASVQVG
ncbi:hypothetical protein [Actinoplanes sp. NPDC049118]|uniref:hypothetical protein n=1 Tax=Actinoplanes sp. NPDC049118 TaxID=3155769 RepID=UPI0033F4432C